ncbi:MAG TPA: Uma2 family endonuclease [Tepidisphaeraceae bacterium]|jgi:Uma2 family endonuclease|nr:Uma2 family endonuclease [Tepidisphaeraceae bacterium]
MTLTAERIYTPEELLGDPALEGHELIDGHLRERPVSKRSSLIGGEILSLLRNEARKTGEAKVYPNDLGYHCFPDSPNTVRFPDVSVVRTSRDREAGDDPGYMPIPADLAVEVLSPNDRIFDVDDKVASYLKAGFGVVWVVNPRWRHVHIYRPDGTVQLLSDREEITGGAALPGFRCRVAEFFDV